MNELELLIDFYRNHDLLGPGSEATTLQALDLIPDARNRSLQIADIGCGTGASTLTLARYTRAQITAVDLFPAFLETLQRRVAHLGLQDRVTTLEKSMDDLPFAPESLDVIWSEGAIYNMGFQAGVSAWYEFLKPGGYLAVSEITWITQDRPASVAEFWQAEYPQIDTAAPKFSILEQAGYTPIGYFVLPKGDWMNHYYAPLEASFTDFLERHGQAAEAQALVREQQNEIRLYREYQDYYSYGFYLARKNG